MHHYVTFRRTIHSISRCSSNAPYHSVEFLPQARALEVLNNILRTTRNINVNITCIDLNFGNNRTLKGHRYLLLFCAYNSEKKRNQGNEFLKKRNELDFMLYMTADHLVYILGRVLTLINFKINTQELFIRNCCVGNWRYIPQLHLHCNDYVTF